MSTIPHVLSSGDFLQDWSATGLISVADDWSGVPGIVGYLGDIDAGSVTGVDPRTLTAAALGAIDVIVNQASTAITNGGIAEFDGLADPTIALQGSGTADAPSLVLYLDATGRKDLALAFTVRDVDGSADDAAQPIAVQYRLGESGAWTNIADAYAPDLTTGGAADRITAFDLDLPAEVNGRADLQLRILTTNAPGSDEWVGIDNIAVTSTEAVESQSVGFAPGSLSFSLTEGDTGENLFTFTVERDGGLTGDVSFSGSLLPGGTTPEDFREAIANFSGLIRDGERTATFSIAVNGDTVFELDETFGLKLTEVANAAGIPTALSAETATASATILNDDAAPGDEVGGITILDMAESLAGSVETPVATNTLEVTRRGSWLSGDGETGSESISFDAGSKRAFVTNAADDALDILDVSNPFAPVKVGEIDLTALPGYGEVNSVAAHDGIVAVAVQNADGGEPGLVALYDTEGTLIKTVTVGVLPDQITFSPDGKLLLVANEGEPYNDETAGVIENAAGSVSIIDISGGPAAATVRNTVGFSALDGFEDQLAELGIHIFEGSDDLPAPTASQDIEPEYVAVSPDGTKAYVTLQEVNAVAVIDLTDTAADKPVSLLPLGAVDFSLIGNEGDFSDRDGAGGSAAISVGNAPVKGLLQPDAIASFEVDGAVYFITANEGDSRIVNNGEEGLNEARASSLGATDADYARYNLDTTWSSEGEFYGFGGRGFSIFRQNADGTIEKVEETGGDFEQILAALPNATAVFNGENGEGFDSRSDNKAAEPEGVVVGEVNGATYAFVALERIGGVMVWDVSNPAEAKYVTYVPPTADDYGPEVIKFIGAEESPTGRALLMTANEISGSVTVYDLEDPAVSKISEIQGAGAESAMVGQTVTVEAIVVGDFQNGDADDGRNLNGFYIQEEAFDADGNPLTSEGVFVYGGTGDVAIGDRVRVTATVSEYFGMTQLNATSIEVIEAGAVEDVTSMAAEVALPAAGTTLSQDGRAQPDLEAYEGMLVTFTDELTLTEQFNLDRFNEVKLVAGERPAQFTAENAPDAAAYAAYQEALGARTITYDDGLNTQNHTISNLDGFGPTYDTATAPRMGDTVTGLTGVLDYQWAGNGASGSTWRVRSVEDGSNTFEQGTPRPAEPTEVGGRLQVASLNVLNYFVTIDTLADSSADQAGDNTALGFDPRGADSAEEFARQTEKLVDAIIEIDADVLALVEIENDFLAGSDGNSIEYLVDQLNAELGAEIYAWVDPGTQFVGGDAIAVGFIYKPSEVTVAYGTTVEILDDADLAGLGLDGLIEQSTVDGVFTGVNTSRAALAVTFEEVDTGAEFTAVANHFKSKSGEGTGADADQLDGQGAWQQQRELAATALAEWVETDPTGSDDADVLLLGDFNAYFEEDAIGLIEEAGYENLQDRLEDPYSYVFDGQTGALDYIFANEGMAEQVTGVTEWHINADEADALDYNTDFGRDPAIFDGDSPVRVSDHDPVIIGLDLEAEEPVAEYTLQLLHFSDGEAGLLAPETAPNLAALVDGYDDDYANTLILAGGDNWIPGPFLAAGTDPSVGAAINAVTGSTITGTIPIAAADIAIHNLIGVEASALGNHDFDLGSNVLASSLSANSGWVGAQFVSVSSNLVVGPSSPYYTDPAATDSPLNGIYVDTVDFNVDPTLNAPATTTTVAEASTLKGKIVPAAIITEGGEKIGIVGATTQILETISSPSGAEIAGYPGGSGPNGEVDDMDLLAAQLQPIIDEMIAEGVDKIILQSHLQVIGNEIELAGKLKGVDIILSAGSNTRMGDEDDEAVDFPGHAADFALDYPYATTDAEGNPILIVNTDNEYTYLGRLVVDFDQNGHIIVDSLTANQGINGAIAATEENVAEAWGTTVDQLDTTAFAEGTKGGDVKTITDAVQAVIEVKDGNVYGYSDVYLEGERGEVRNEETNLGNLSADANGGSLGAALNEALGTAAEETYVVSLKNGGGIRAQIGTLSAPDPVDGTVDKLPPEGGVSQLDVENSLRFNNKLIAFDTSPEGLKAILEHGVASYGNQGRFPQIGGVAFSFDPDAPAGSRILDMALVDEEGNTLVQLYDDGVLLEDVPASISVVTLNFLADGGDGYPIKANGENFRYLLDDGTLGPVLDPASDLDATPPANALGEQAAFERYMRENHGTEETAYDKADTDVALDERIQNLGVRVEDTVLVAEEVSFSGGSSADISEGGALDDVLSGNAGADLLKGHGGDDLLRGGAGDDLLIGGAGADTILGGSGADEIYAGEQDDEVEGGRGDDRLLGGDGSDTYSYEAGDGSDTVVEDKGEGDADVLVFQDIESDEVTFGRAGADVVVRLEDGSIITLAGQADGSGGVEEIVFADGEALDRDAILGSLENSPPAAGDDQLAPVAEDTEAFEVAFADLLANDEDGDGDTLTITGVKNVVGGVAELTATGIRFTPAANFNGAASFVYTVADGEGGTAEATASFTVRPVNDAPVAVDDAGSAGENEAKLFDLLANDTDADGEALTLAGIEVTSVSGIELSAEEVEALFSVEDGKVAFAPGLAFDGLNDGESATVTLAYTVADATGGTDEGQFVLTVDGVSDFNPITGTDRGQTITGTELADLIDALGGNDRVNAGAGDDSVLGGTGNDRLSGEAGNDRLDGQAGNDQLRGGDGIDTFVFHSGYGRDTVLDFADGTDLIEIDADDYADFAALEADGAIDGGFLGTTITLDDGSRLTLRGVNAATLSADDFRFA